MNPEIDRVRNEIEREISLNLSKIGLFYRIFSRVKSSESIKTKLDRGARREEGRKIQDLIGIRIVCYFRQDECIVEAALKRQYILENESVSSQTADIFSPTRKNFVFKIRDSHRLTISNALIDNTFEVQIRTVFSEGWHEVEHDIRYKHQDLWNNINSNRELNSVYATLEMCDWGIERIMADMAYSGYKSGNIIQMLTGKFMLRLVSSALPENISDTLKDRTLQKSIFKCDRRAIVTTISLMRSTFPITPQLLVFICNHVFIQDERISLLTPSTLIEILHDKPS